MEKLLFCSLLLVAPLLGVVAPATAAGLSLSAAASLKEVVTELADNFAKEHPEVKFSKNFGASGVLAKQIENGLPADLFIAANVEWVAYLLGKKFIAANYRAPLAYNALVFSGQAESGVKGLADLPRLARIAIGSPKSVPAGEYALAALEKAGVAAALAGKLVMAKDARECMIYAERGEVDGALVYRTDALLLGKLTRILFTVPPGLHARITYPLALTRVGGEKPEAVAFFAYLLSPAAKEVLTRYGFTVP